MTRDYKHQETLAEFTNLYLYDPRERGPRRGLDCATGLDNPEGGEVRKDVSSSDDDDDQDNAGASTGAFRAAQTGDGGSGRLGYVLPDGTPVSLCLWAVEVNLPHPITREPLHLELPEPAIFHYIRSKALEGHQKLPEICDN